MAEQERISTAVVDAVAAATGRDPLELPPLYDAIDLEVLDRLFRVDDTGCRRFSGRIEFTVAGCDVTVHADGRVVAVPTGSIAESQTVSAR